MPDQPGELFELPDVNVLVALTNPSHQHHGAAHSWLSRVERFATTPITESGLVRLLLNRSVTGQEVTGRQAVDLLHRLRAHQRTTFLPDDSTLASAVIDLAGLGGHKQTTDFHLVNLAAAHGGVLTTFDGRLPKQLTGQDQRHVRVL